MDKPLTVDRLWTDCGLWTQMDRWWTVNCGQTVDCGYTVDRLWIVDSDGQMVDCELWAINRPWTDNGCDDEQGFEVPTRL